MLAVERSAPLPLLRQCIRDIFPLLALSASAVIFPSHFFEKKRPACDMLGREVT
ncbi:hypothetical protein QFZ60_001574 [Arthrobacter sp. B2I5]|nr:hypothetical protein [Arthrobacter sp. B2I5]